MKAIYRDVTGRRPRWYRLPRFALRLAAREFASQLEWHNRVNFSLSLDDSCNGRVQLTSFEDFLRAHPGVRL